jgi:hypothetical protein
MFTGQGHCFLSDRVGYTARRAQEVRDITVSFLDLLQWAKSHAIADIVKNFWYQHYFIYSSLYGYTNKGKKKVNFSLCLIN